MTEILESEIPDGGSKPKGVRLLWRKLNARRDHRWAMGHFSNYVDGELSPRHRRRLEGHRGICPECRHAIETLKKLVMTLPGLRADDEELRRAAEQATSAALDQIRGEPGPESRPAT
jgi:anti-sigma factor RsiW